MLSIDFKHLFFSQKSLEKSSSPGSRILEPGAKNERCGPFHFGPMMMIWVFPKIGVPPNHPILIGFSLINPPFWGTPIFGNTHIVKGKINKNTNPSKIVHGTESQFWPRSVSYDPARFLILRFFRGPNVTWVRPLVISWNKQTLPTGTINHLSQGLNSLYWGWSSHL